MMRFSPAHQLGLEVWSVPLSRWAVVLYWCSFPCLSLLVVGPTVFLAPPEGAAVTPGQLLQLMIYLPLWLMLMFQFHTPAIVQYEKGLYLRGPGVLPWGEDFQCRWNRTRPGLLVVAFRGNRWEVRVPATYRGRLVEALRQHGKWEEAGPPEEPAAAASAAQS